MTIDAVLFMGTVFAWWGLMLLAPLVTAWAYFRRSNRHATAVVSLCLWCVLAGGVVMGSLWSCIARMTQHAYAAQLRDLPEGTKPAEIQLKPIAVETFFIKADEFVQFLAYTTILIPLFLAARLVKRTLHEHSAQPWKPVPQEPDDELFSPYGP
ncbi:hypothetical protein [Singulisphaera sp. PoT]|uniref:hypothetical protein n=1 Tax=Singulisphaera sp. PoT TaxID=3411797 RepID=UPI003BF5386F